MKRSSIFIAMAVLALSACGTSTNSANAPALDLKLVQTYSSGSDMYYFAGPVNVQYALQVTNPTNQTFTLRQLNLQTQGPGAYSLRTGNSPMNATIPPGTTTVTMSAWGRAAGGFLRGNEPVNIHGTAYLRGPNGDFVKIFNEVLGQ
ncbi:MAG TPA: hypothetical protein VF980_09060 [Thermoanaerobaculia bacterium]